MVSDEENAEVGSYTITRTGAAAEDVVRRYRPSFLRSSATKIGLKRCRGTGRVAYRVSGRMPGRSLPWQTRVPTQFHPELTGNDNRQRF